MDGKIIDLGDLDEIKLMVTRIESITRADVRDTKVYLESLIKTDASDWIIIHQLKTEASTG